MIIARFFQTNQRIVFFSAPLLVGRLREGQRFPWCRKAAPLHSHREREESQCRALPKCNQSSTYQWPCCRGDLFERKGKLRIHCIVNRRRREECGGLRACLEWLLVICRTWPGCKCRHAGAHSNWNQSLSPWLKADVSASTRCSPAKWRHCQQSKTDLAIVSQPPGEGTRGEEGPWHTTNSNTDRF